MSLDAPQTAALVQRAAHVGLRLIEGPVLANKQSHKFRSRTFRTGLPAARQMSAGDVDRVATQDCVVAEGSRQLLTQVFDRLPPLWVGDAPTYGAGAAHLLIGFASEPAALVVRRRGNGKPG